MWVSCLGPLLGSAEGYMVIRPLSAPLPALLCSPQWELRHAHRGHGKRQALSLSLGAEDAPAGSEPGGLTRSFGRGLSVFSSEAIST